MSAVPEDFALRIEHVPREQRFSPVTRLYCSGCHRPCGPGDTVYRPMLGNSDSIYCGGCVDAARAEDRKSPYHWIANRASMKLAPARPCACCARPFVLPFDGRRTYVSIRDERMLERTIACCSPTCERYLRRQRLRKGAPVHVCKRCATSIAPPARADARYCSPACKQAAYRQRRTESTTPPAPAGTST
jgi:hypothetical protein